MPSTLFTNAKVWQPDGSFTESFGINTGHIDFTGSNIEAKSLSANYTQVIDLGNKLVLPGLIDGHLHLVKGSQMRKLLDCSKINSIQELRESIKKYVNQNHVKWVIGGNLDLGKVFGSYRLSGVNIADEIFNDLPLYITNYDYHSAICNSKAIEITGLDSAADNYTGSEIERDTNGNYTGIIREKAMEHIIQRLPVPTLDEKVNAVIDCIKMLHSYGITSVSDITLPEDIDVYLELSRRNELKIRVNSYIPFAEFDRLQHFEEITKEIDLNYFSINGFKAFWDGALGSETALFSLNYKGKGHNGYKTELVTSGKIFELAEKIDNAGKQMIIHAIGDKAVYNVLDLYAKLPNTKKLRHRIEHAQHINPKNYKRFGKLGVIASVQPLHLKYDARTVFEKLPEELIPNTHNYVHILVNGGIINFGTDFPIVEANPFENIRLAVTRHTEYGEFTPEHKIPIHECIKAYTINNAYSNHNDNAVGSIIKGKVADFVIMDTDLFEIEPDELSEAKVYKTYLNGEEVYSAT